MCRYSKSLLIVFTAQVWFFHLHKFKNLNKTKTKFSRKKIIFNINNCVNILVYSNGNYC